MAGYGKAGYGKGGGLAQQQGFSKQNPGSPQKGASMAAYGKGGSPTQQQGFAKQNPGSPQKGAPMAGYGKGGGPPQQQGFAKQNPSSPQKGAAMTGYGKGGGPPQHQSPQKGAATAGYGKGGASPQQQGFGKQNAGWPQQGKGGKAAASAPGGKSRAVSPEGEKKKKKKKILKDDPDDYDYYGAWFGGIEGFFDTLVDAPEPAPVAAAAEVEKSGAKAAEEEPSWAQLLGWEDEPPPKAKAVNFAWDSSAGKGGAAKSTGKGMSKGKAKVKGKAASKGKAKAQGKAKAKADISFAWSKDETPRSQASDPDDGAEDSGFDFFTDQLPEIDFDAAWTGLFGEVDPDAETAQTGGEEAQSGGLTGLLEGTGLFVSDDSFDLGTKEKTDDGLFGVTALFGSKLSTGPPPLPPPPPAPLPPPPPPEPPPPPISRLRPWAPQLRALTKANRSSEVELKEKVKTEPKLPPLALDRFNVTADRRKALPDRKGLIKKDADALRDGDVTLCVADDEDRLSEPESQGSADSISGDIVRAWDPASKDSRWQYSRDTAVPFSDPWKPLNWNDAQWMNHLEKTGAYNPQAREEALEAKYHAEKEQEELMKAAALTNSLREDPANLQQLAYQRIQADATPRGIAMNKFMPVPPDANEPRSAKNKFMAVPVNDPVMVPALNEALKARALRNAGDASGDRGGATDFSIEFDVGRMPGGGRSTAPMAPWEEPVGIDHCLDVPGRAWL